MGNRIDLISKILIWGCLAFGFIYFVSPFSCSKNTKMAANAFQVSTLDNISPEAKDLVSRSLPKIREACPGLEKFGTDLKNNIIHDYMGLDEKESRKVTIEVVVPNGESIIPDRYRAWGQHCYLDVSADGSSLSVAKTACKSVCMDEDFNNDDGSNLVLSLQ